MRTVDFETAKALQELGYDEEYINFYRPNGRLDNIIDYLVIADPLIKGRIPAPRLDDAAYWIRDKHRISIETLWWVGARHWKAYAYDMDADDSLYFSCQDDDYDSALEAAVKRAINLIKKRKR